MERVLNSVVLLELITGELKFVIGSDGLLIVVIVKNGNLGSMFLLRLGNGLGSEVLIISLVNELNVVLVVLVSVMVVVSVSSSASNKSNDRDRKGSHIIIDINYYNEN